MQLSQVRPSHLPDFTDPPLNEVVLGVQFGQPAGYQQIRAGEVWALYKSEFPLVQEQPALEPAFETFGLPHFTGGGLSLISGAVHDRFWFLRSDGDELIQFQQDRLLHNWRKVGNEKNSYPRYERMAERFSSELDTLQSYFTTLTPQRLQVNQCEISYINHIPIGGETIDLSKWLRGVSLANLNIEDIGLNFREVIRGSHGQPIGRLTYSVGLGLKPNHGRIIVFTITARGAPEQADILSAMRFIERGRELIVTRFAEIATEEAQVLWGRKL